MSRNQTPARMMSDVDTDSDSASSDGDTDPGEGMIVTFESEVTDEDRALINHMLDTTPQYGVVERNGWVTLPVLPFRGGELA